MAIAVVIPVWNRPRLVLEALESVASQTHAPARVVVVDDGSTDGSDAGVEAWLAGRSDVAGWSLERAPHRGASEGRNTGLALIGECDRVAFLDSDDLWPPDMLARAAAAFKARPKLVGVCADRFRVDCTEGTTVRDDLSCLERDPLKWMVLHGAGIGSCSVMSTEAVRDAGGYPAAEPTGHDIILLARLFASGPWAHLPGKPVTFRRNHAAQYHEQDHIYRTLPDANARWARLMETAHEELSRTGTPTRGVRKAMARRWVSVAKDCYRAGRLLEGRDCLRRSRSHWPYSVRNLKWRIRFALRSDA